MTEKARSPRFRRILEKDAVWASAKAQRQVMIVQTGLTTIAQGSLVATGSQSEEFARYVRAPGTYFYFVSLGDAWPQWVLSLGVFCLLVVAFASGIPSPFSSPLLVHKLPGALGLTPATRGGSYKYFTAAYI